MISALVIATHLTKRAVTVFYKQVSTDQTVDYLWKVEIKTIQLKGYDLRLDFIKYSSGFRAQLIYLPLFVAYMSLLIIILSSCLPDTKVLPFRLALLQVNNLLKHMRVNL